MFQIAKPRSRESSYPFVQRVLAPARIIFRHRGFIVVLICSLLLGLAYSFVTPFLSMFGTIAVGMSSMRFGAFMVVMALSAIVASTFLARWSDTHWSRRRVLVFGGACGALGYGAFAFLRDPLWLTLVGATVLAGSTITFSQLFAHARELLDEYNVPVNEAPLYNNFFRLFFALAWTIGPAVASWVMIGYSYRGLFLSAAGIFVVFLLFVLRFIPNTRPKESTRKVVHTPLRETLTRRDVLGYFIGFVLINTCSTISMMNLPLMVLHTLHGTPHDVGIVYGVGPIFELPLMIYFGVLASKGDQSGVIRTGTLIAIFYYSLLLFVRVPWHVYPLQLLSAAMVAVNSGIAITFFQNYLPGQPGTATNLFVTSARIGSTAGYLLFGWLAETIGYRQVFGACALLSAVTFGLFLVHERRERSLPSGTT